MEPREEPDRDEEAEEGKGGGAWFKKWGGELNVRGKWVEIGSPVYEAFPIHQSRCAYNAATHAPA